MKGLRARLSLGIASLFPKDITTLLILALVCWSCATSHKPDSISDSDTSKTLRTGQSSPAVATSIQSADLKTLWRQAAFNRVKSPFFWRIEKDGKTNWILGTIHAGVPAGKIPWSVLQKAKGARLFAIEANPDQIAKDGPIAGFLAQELKNLQGGPDHSLKLKLGAEAFSHLVTGTRMPPAVLDTFKAPAAHFFYELMTFASLMGELPHGNLDMELHKMAQGRSIKTQYLGSIRVPPKY